MKKVISIVTVLVLCLSLLAGCGQSSAPASSSSSAPAPASSSKPADSKPAADDPYADVKPLAEPAELTIGALSGGHHGLPSYIAEQMGAFKKANIKINWKIFGNGPVMVEAAAANGWDVGTYGIGGTLTGALGQGIIHIGTPTNDEPALTFWVKADDPIVKAGKVTKDAPELYGTADTWKGREIYVPIGTTLHYALAKGLEKLGLKDTDVKLTHMDVANINTAMRAGKGQIWALWGNFTYASDLKDKGYVCVMNASDVKGYLNTSMCVNAKSYNDPKKKEAIKKWAEIYFKTVDWMNTGNNLDKAVKMFGEWNETTGVKSTEAELKAYLSGHHRFSLKENYDMFNTKTPDGKMTMQEKPNYDPLMFFISKGNYKTGDDEKFIKSGFNGEIVKALFEASQKK